MWSIGVIAFILLTGHPLQNDDARSCETISASAGAKDFISKLLTADPVKRLTAQQALRHDWMVTTLHQCNLVGAFKKMKII